jgi:YfiR/HmsC-like
VTASWRNRLRCALLVCGALLSLRMAFGAGVAEHEVKLALTYKLAKFVTWPAQREATSTFVLCVLGQHPFETALDGLSELKIKERAIAVRQIAASEQAGACDLLFIAESESDHLPDVLTKLADKPVLTISDMPRFAKRGGIVELQSRDNHIGFEINVPAYRRAGLVISSQLLQLATLLDDPQERVP